MNKKLSLAAVLMTASGLIFAGVAPAQAVTSTPGTTKVPFVASYLEFSRTSPDGSTIAYMDERDSKVFLLNTATNTVTTVTDGSSVIGEPGQAVFSPDGTTLYVADYTHANVAVINVASASVTKALTSSDFNGPWAIVIAPSGDHLYVGDYSNHSIVDYNLTNDTTVSTAGSQYPYAMYTSADGSIVYAVDYYGPIVKYGTADQSTTTWSNVSGDFYNACVNSDTSVLYMPDSNGGDLYSVSLADGSVIQHNSSLSITSSVEGCTVSPDNAKVFLTSDDVGGTGTPYSVITTPGEIYEVDATTLDYVTSYGLDGVAYTINVNFVSNCKAYVNGYYGNAQTFDYGTCDAAPTAEPALAVTGVNSTNVGLLAGGAALVALLGAGVVMTARRRKARI